MIRYLLPGGFAVLLATASMGDTLLVDPIDPEAAPAIEVGIHFENTNGIVGLQFDLRYAEEQVGARPALLALETGHRLRSRDLGERQRVVVYSPSNAGLPNDLLLEFPLDLKGNSPSGGPALRLENITLTDANGNSYPANVGYHPVEAWRQEHFTEADLADPSVIGDDSDPDLDGLANLFEFLFGTDPKSPDSRDLLATGFTATQQAGEPELWWYDFVFPMTVGEGTEVWAEESPDLELWMDSGLLPVPVGPADPQQFFRIRIPVDLGDPENFYRLRARRRLDADPVTAFLPAVPFDEWIRDQGGAESRLAGNPDRSADPDRDGLINVQEFLLGSNPFLFDSGRAPSLGWRDARNACHDLPQMAVCWSGGESLMQVDRGPLRRSARFLVGNSIEVLQGVEGPQGAGSPGLRASFTMSWSGGRIHVQ